MYSRVSFKMRYSKCGLCLKDLEVIRLASGISYIRCVDWKFCPFFCREDSIHSYQECLFNRVIPQYKVHEGGQLPYCRHTDAATLRVSRSQKNPFRPYFTCRRKEMCRFFQWADELPVDVSKGSSPPQVDKFKQIHFKTQATKTICRFRQLPFLNTQYVCCITEH